MEITEVRVYPVTRPDERLLAYATLTFDDEFVVRDLRIIRGNGGVFVAMPSRKRQDGTYSDVAHPLRPELRKKIEDQVLQAYHAEIAKPQSERAAEDAGSGLEQAPKQIAV